MKRTHRSTIATMVLAALLPACAAKIHGTVQLVDAGAQPVAKESLQGIVVNMINTTAAVEQASHAVTTNADGDRKSTRLNSSHSQISYAVFCLKKKKGCCAAPSAHSSTG